jgi:uncharacterized protein YkwD
MARPAETRTARRGRALGVAVVAFVAFALLRPVPAAEARPTDTSALIRLLGGEVGAFVEQINLLRTALGLQPLAVSDQLTRVATSWSQHMAAQGDISHNPDLSALVSGWTGLAENVGAGWGVLSLMDAFIASPSHYVNLVHPSYTHVGVGVAFGADGAMYTTHDFMAAEHASAPDPEPQPEPDPAPRPRAPRAPAPAAPPPAEPTPAPTPEPPPIPVPHPTQARVAAVLEPLRTLEAR